jgi:hypothetical protein
MPRMSIRKKAISMTRMDTWTDTSSATNANIIERFCTESCPHPEKPCNGDCQEFKEFSKKNRSRKK